MNTESLEKAQSDVNPNSDTETNDQNAVRNLWDKILGRFGTLLIGDTTFELTFEDIWADLSYGRD